MIRLMIVAMGGLAFLSASCVRLPEPPSISTPVSSSPTSEAALEAQQIGTDDEPLVMTWLMADNLHTAMVFDFQWLMDSGFVPPADFGSPKYVAMSWGDREAYMSERWLSPWAVVYALFLPSPAVMEMIPINWSVVEVCPSQKIWRAMIPRDRGPELAHFLNYCSQFDATGRPQVLGPSSWGEGVLLASRHSYYFPRICNVWTGQALEACGLEIPSLSSIKASSLTEKAATFPNGFEQIWWGDAQADQSQ